MTQDNQFGSSGAPVAGQVSPEERAAGVATSEEKQANDALAGSEVEAPPEGFVAYVASEEFATSRFLVKAGEPKYRPQEGMTSPGLRLREGDVWAVFTAGILVSDDPLVIAWCEAHPTRCRRSDDPMTKSWATLKGLSADRANRERLLATDEIDADAAFPPNALDSALAAQAAKEGSAGANAVRDAEISRESAAKVAAGSGS